MGCFAYRHLPSDLVPEDTRVVRLNHRHQDGGAALACPERTVFALLGDGGAMYTNQYLWTAAREGLKLVTVIYSNRRYGILDVEYRRLGSNDVGERAASLFDLSRPGLDWVAMAAAQGVPGARVDSCESFAAALRAALAADGPYLIEALV